MRSLWPIRTGRSQVPWIWVFALSGPWAAKLFFEQISNVAITFKLREFTSAPAIIAAVGSLNMVFSILVGASCNYASDRVWTPWGRRKPFLLFGWGSIAIGCLILPEAKTLWLLITALFFYEMLRDVDNPTESLINEVVPPHQRGRSQATMNWVREVLKVLFFAVLIGRWDHIYRVPGIGEIEGERIVFWTGSLIAILSMLFVGFGIKETPPARQMEEKSVLLMPKSLWKTIRNFFRDVFAEKQWRAIYAVSIAQMIFWIGFGSLTPLLYTEQWGFTKQDYGNIIALGSPFTLFLFLPLGGWLADRLDRLSLFKITATGITCCHLAFFIYLKLRTGGNPPPFSAVLCYWLLQTGIGMVGVVSTVSMMFDFVPRNRLGTVSSGIGITRGVATIFVNNGIGLWITFSSKYFGNSAPGEYDYESGFLYLILCGCAATWVAFWFSKQVVTGKLSKLGVIEANKAKD